MGTPQTGSGRRWLLPVSVVTLLAVGIAATLVAPDYNGLIGFFGLLLGLGTAVVLLVRRSRVLSPRERNAWLWLAGAMASMWTGVLVVGVLSEIGVTLRSFGAQDVFFLFAYAAIIISLYKLSRLDSGGQEWVLTLVDATVGAVALSALVWNFVFHDLMAKMAGAPWWEVAIATIYPVGDVTLVVGLLILIMRRSNYYQDLRLTFLALGATAQVLADFIFLNRGIGEDFTTAEPAWAVNLIATIFLVLTGAIVDRVPRKREFPEAPTPVWALVWPYLLAAALIADPDVLILDEPTNALDPAGIMLLRTLLQRSRERGAATLVSSHHLDEVARVADRITVVNEGRTVGALDPCGIDLERQFFDLVYRDSEARR